MIELIFKLLMTFCAVSVLTGVALEAGWLKPELRRSLDKWWLRVNVSVACLLVVGFAAASWWLL